MCNRYKNHLVIIPEDQKMLDLVNGALLMLNTRHVCVENIAGGQPHVFGALNSDQKWQKSYFSTYKNSSLLLLIDFDDKFEIRYQQFQQLVQSTFHDRIFLLGVDHKETDDLKSFFNHQSWEHIGKLLLNDCPNGDLSNWNNKHLACNLPEIQRMKQAGILDWLFTS